MKDLKVSPNITNLTIKFCATLFIYCVSVIVTIFLALIRIPCKVYRKFVIIFASLFRRDLRPLTNPISVILSDDNYQNPSNLSVVTILRMEGNMAVSQVISLFQRHVIDVTLPLSNVARYPELQEYQVSFLGYPFWKRDVTVSIENHIRDYEQISLLPISKILQVMLNTPFQNLQSPWQLTIFRSGHHNRTFLALRFHHTLGDAKSILKLLVGCLGCKNLTTKEPSFDKRTTKMSIKKRLQYCSLLPFSRISTNAALFKSILKTSQHPWNPREPLKTVPPLFCGVTGKIPLNKVKDIAKVSGVVTSAVIMSTIGNAVEKFLQIKDLFQLSDTFPIYAILPKECHPETLTNHLYVCVPELPRIDDDFKRLQICNKVYKYIRHTDCAKNLTWNSSTIALFPKPLRLITYSIGVTTAGISNIAGEQEEFSVGGFPCLGMIMCTGLQQGSNGVSFTVLSYKESIQVSVVAKGNILSERETVTMARLVEKEFINLRKVVLG